jgi:hypothetical protein
VEHIGGHRYDDEHGEQALPATPANQDHEREGGRRQQPPEPGRGPGTQMMSPWVRAVRWPIRRGICQLGTTT